MQIEIERDTPLADVRRLFREYADSLDFTLDFQDFDDELAALPGDYAPPRGALFVARVDGDLGGCVGLREFGEGACELKRLFVREAQRGSGLGRRLTDAAIETARELGYVRMRLDTTPSMQAAQALYRSLGFREIASYRPNPIHGATFFELEL
jgi:ribosomal protein S18 acetylase RimI-like enzyme